MYNNKFDIKYISMASEKQVVYWMGTKRSVQIVCEQKYTIKSKNIIIISLMKNNVLKHVYHLIKHNRYCVLMSSLQIALNNVQNLTENNKS